MADLLVATGLIFVAELGDKSQLLTLAFATRQRALPVLLGLTLATVVLTGLSVLVGELLGAALPVGVLGLVSGAIFLAVAAWTLWSTLTDDDDEPGDVTAPRATSGVRVVLAVAGAFFLAELGDKTMFATAALATREGVATTWAGAVIGMVGANALAVVAGRSLGDRLDRRVVGLVTGALFAIFGIVLIVSSV